MAPPGGLTGKGAMSEIIIRQPTDLADSGPTVGQVVDEALERHQRVRVMAMTILVLNALDLFVTQYLLRTHTASHEGNALLSGIVLSPWAWVPKLGVPAFVLASVTRRPVSRASYVGLHVVYGIYWAVVWWNIHFLFS
jgi:hypothetical protein